MESEGKSALLVTPDPRSIDQWMGLMCNLEWMQHERDFLKVCLPHKGLMYNSTSMLTSNLAGERLSDAE